MARTVYPYDTSSGLRTLYLIAFSLAPGDMMTIGFHVMPCADVFRGGALYTFHVVRLS